MSPRALAAMIDHTLLKADATADQVATLCREAVEHGFASVCVNPYWVPMAGAEVAGSAVKVCTVIGFPLGATSTRAKMAEAEIALREGAAELDMVMNVGALRSGELAVVETDIANIAILCHDAGAIVKTILETAYLDDEQKRLACKLARAAGADFVKTSTGFAAAGASAADVALMRGAVGPEMGVKASGGIRTYEDAMRMIEAGANRIGASASVRIVEAAG